jgi:hypothetical protein
LRSWTQRRLKINYFRFFIKYNIIDVASSFYLFSKLFRSIIWRGHQFCSINWVFFFLRVWLGMNMNERCVTTTSCPVAKSCFSIIWSFGLYALRMSLASSMTLCNINEKRINVAVSQQRRWWEWVVVSYSLDNEGWRQESEALPPRKIILHRVYLI